MSSYVFVLKVTDEPGGMELIAATFAHRGVSLTGSLGNDGTLDPEGRATVLVTFSATPAKKEILRRALSRLPRVRSITEHPLDSPTLRKTAVVRLQGNEPWSENSVRLHYDASADLSTHFLAASPAEVDACLMKAREEGRLRDATATVIGL